MGIAIRSLTAILLISAYASGTRAEWGHLTGRFIYDGPAPEAKFISTGGKDKPACGDKVLDESLLVDKKTGGIANIVVFLRSKDVKIHPDYEATAKVDVPILIEKCRYSPHILLLRVSQTMMWINKDKLGYAPMFGPAGQHGMSNLLVPGQSFPFVYQRQTELMTPMGCAIHDWMRAYVVCRDNPYMAVTNEDGTFDIKQLPAGEHEFQFLHEKTWGLVAKPAWLKGRAKFTIKADETTELGEIKLDPSLFIRQMK